MRNTADVIGGKSIAILLQSISDVSAINPLVVFYNIHGGKREVLFFYFVQDTTRLVYICIICIRITIIKTVAVQKRITIHLYENDKYFYQYDFFH
jgi:hypothetical protein